MNTTVIRTIAGGATALPLLLIPALCGDARTPAEKLRDTSAAPEECEPGSPPACRPAALTTLQDFAPFQPAGYFFNANACFDFIRQAHAAPRTAGTRITAESLWQIDNEPTDVRHAKWRGMIDAGVSMILTDHPEDLVNMLQTEYPQRLGGAK